MILAAGGIVERATPAGIEILLVHRARYSDDEWSLPKGKVETGESLEETAVREVREETGCEIRLGEFLGATHYDVSGKPKEVSFWRMSLMPVDPDPTPKKTNPSANAKASSTNIHFAWFRSR